MSGLQADTLNAPAAEASRRLPRLRRFYALVAFALLAAPLVVGIVRPDDKALVEQEGRRLAPAPAFPTTWEAWRALPAEIDAYLKDRFGLRHAMIRLHHDLSHPVVLKT